MEIHPLIVAGSSFAIVSGVIGFAFWLGNFRGEWKEKANTLKKNEEDCQTLKDSIAEIKASITILLNKSGLSTISQNSPVGLTPKGEEIRKKVQADRVITEKYDHFQKRV